MDEVFDIAFKMAFVLLKDTDIEIDSIM